MNKNLFALSQPMKLSIENWASTHCSEKNYSSDTIQLSTEFFKCPF